MQIRDLKESSKIIIMAALFSGACFLMYYYHAIRGTDVIFTHLFYIPIVLASIWWKRRGLAVAALLGLLLVVSHVFFAPDIPLIPDLCRAAMFVVIASAVAFLSEQIAAASLLYKTLASSSHTGIYILQDGKVQYLNQRAVEYTGFPEDELLKMSPLDPIHPDDREKAQKNAVQMLKGIRKEPYEFRLITGDGKIKWIMETVTPIQFRGRKAILGNAMDITDRKRVEEALRESEERFRRLENATWEGIVIHREGIIMDANESALKMLGYPAEEVIGQSILTFLAPESIEPALQKLREGIDTPQIYLEAKGLRKDKTVFPIELLGRPIRYKNLDARVIAIRDITERKRSEQALKESQERYHLFFEEAQDGIAMADAETGEIADCNQALCRMTERDKTELIGQHQRILHPQHQLKNGDSPSFRLHKTGDPGQTLEDNLLSKSGKMIPVEINASRVRMNGRDYILGIFRDISERKRSEQALKESEEKYRNILENMNDSYFETDLQGNMTFCNPMVSKSLGYPPEEMAGMNHRVYMDQENAEIVEKNFRDVYRENIPSKVISYEVTRKDGTNAYVETSLSLIKNKDGHSIGYRGMGRDITDRKMAEEALKESEKKYNELAHSLPQIVFEADMNGTLTFVNNAAYSMSGYSPEEFEKGLNALQMLVPEDREGAGLNMKRIMQGEKLRGNEYTFLRKDGRTFPVITETIPIVRNNQIVGLRGIIIDITERKQFEAHLAEMRKMESLGKLASGAAHEIRNPLNIMSLRFQMLDVTGKILDDDVRKVIDTCNNQIRRITGVLDGLQEFSRMPLAEKRLDDLNKIIGGVVDSFDAKFKSEGITAEIGRGEDIPPFMLDKEKIAMVITHLISNAVDAMRGQDIRHLIISTDKLSAKDDAGQSVRIVVSDTGHGIKKEEMARIFDPFFTTKDPDKGKGLGLAVAYGIIREHGGRIWAENNEWGGATFIIELPIGESPVS